MKKSNGLNGDLNHKRNHTMHYENTPIQIYWKFYNQKKKIIREKIQIFFMFLLKT